MRTPLTLPIRLPLLGLPLLRLPFVRSSAYDHVDETERLGLVELTPPPAIAFDSLWPFDVLWPGEQASVILKQCLGALLLLITVVALLSLSWPASAQSLTPSIYAGVGTGTNLGGTIGVGTEVRIGPYSSFSAAIGFNHGTLEDGGVDGSPLDFDVGVKAYPLSKVLFVGINYGFVDARFVDGGSRLHSVRAFSFTAGLRTGAWRGFYGSTYLGTTSDAGANRPVGSYIPRFGLLVGYEVSR